MNRVSLLIDDYSELMFIQIVLKKLGFDVDTLQNIHTLADHLLNFHPSLIIMTEDGRRFSADAVMKQASSQLPGLKFILLKGRATGSETVSGDVLRIGSPIQPKELIEATSHSFQLDAAGLIEKFQKFRGQLNLSQVQERHLDLQDEDGGEFIQPSQEPDRDQGYRAYLKKQAVKVKSTFRTEDVQKLTRAEREAASLDQEINSERRSFVAELFRKKTS